MIKIFALNPINYKNKMFSAGEVIEVENNDAFGLVDSGKAEVFVPEKPTKKKDEHFKKEIKERVYRYK